MNYGVYPLLPENRMIVGGVKIDEEFGMILMDGYSLTPPKPKTYEVDVPGANGKIDLTDFFGDVVYNNKSDKFTFMVFNVEDVEALKTRIANFLHGKKFDYSYSMDTYMDGTISKWYKHRGRFEISSYKHEVYSDQMVVTFEITVDSDPYKYRDPIQLLINASGGVMLYLESGRMPVIPKITHTLPIKIMCNGVTKEYEEAGTIEDPDFKFTTGINDMYINSFPLHYLSWDYLVNQQITWGNFGSKALYEWYKLGHDPQNVDLLWWKDLNDRQVTWGEFGTKTLSEWYDDGSEHYDDPRIILLEYERGDL